MKIDDAITRILKKEKARERRRERKTPVGSCRFWRRRYRAGVKSGVINPVGFKSWLRTQSVGTFSGTAMAKKAAKPKK